MQFAGRTTVYCCMCFNPIRGCDEATWDWYKPEQKWILVDVCIQCRMAETKTMIIRQAGFEWRKKYL